MGVCPQTYRVRIGTFYPSARVKANKDQVGPERNQYNWNYKIQLIYLILIFSFLLLLTINFNQESSIIPPIIAKQPSSACNGSFGTLCQPGMSKSNFNLKWATLHLQYSAGPLLSPTWPCSTPPPYLWSLLSPPPPVPWTLGCPEKNKVLKIFMES